MITASEILSREDFDIDGIYDAVQTCAFLGISQGKLCRLGKQNLIERHADPFADCIKFVYSGESILRCARHERPASDYIAPKGFNLKNNNDYGTDAEECHI